MYRNTINVASNMFHLPKELQDKIYQYDSTYHIFCTQDFKRELSLAYFGLQSVRRKAIQSIEEFFNEMRMNNITWSGVGAYMQDGLWMYDEEHYHEWQELNENYRIDLSPNENSVLFRLLPRLGRWDPGNKYDGLVRQDGTIVIF